jgi:ELWxxDGT repeat protein
LVKHPHRRPRAIRRSAFAVGHAFAEVLEGRRLLSTALLSDVNTANGDSFPDQLADINGTLYFSAFTPATGVELWKTDGTPAGTAMVKDAVPGVSGLYPQEMTARPDGTVFFTGYANDSGDRELWKTDGTAGGTVLVRDIRPDGASNPHGLTAVGGLVFFAANDGVHGDALWKTDGTEAGTVMVKDFRPDAQDGSVENLTAHGGKVYLVATGPGQVRQLWSSDGTDAGTSQLIVGQESAFSDNFRLLVSSGDWLYFTHLNSAGDDVELWKTDGTAAGTSTVIDLRHGPGSTTFYDMVDAGGSLVFVASPDANGPEIFRTDGTAAGTVALTDLNTGGGGSVGIRKALPVGSSVYFTTSDDAVYRTDGTPSGTTKLGTFPSTNQMPMAAAGGVVYFGAVDADADTTTLYRTDGTPAGTFPVRTFAGSFPSEIRLEPLGDRLAVAGRDPQYGFELWLSDGTAAGTTLVSDINSARQGSYTAGNPPAFRTPLPAEIIDGGGARRLVFYGIDVTRNRGLWSTDGTAAGTVKLMTAGRTGTITALASAGARALFVVEKPLVPARLWVTDGTPAGTHPLGDTSLLVEPLSASPNTSADSLTGAGGFVYFSAAKSGGPGTVPDYNLWKSDGTAAGTTLVRDLPDASATASAGPRGITGVNGSVFFTTTNDRPGNELWKSDGSAGGTVPLASFEAGQGATSTNAHDLTHAGEYLFFTIQTSTQRQLWRSDGTAAGTILLGSFGRLGADEALNRTTLAAVGNRVVFAAAGGFTGNTELWVSDGTPAGTTLLKEIFTGNSPSNPNDFQSAGDRAFFMARSAQNGSELWVTDGTAEGTHLVVEFSPGTGNSNHDLLYAKDGVVYFRAAPAATVGSELWASDGTAAGTRLVEDVNPGPASSSPIAATTFGDKLVFWADDGTHGTEPWIADHVPAARGPRVVARRAFYNHSAFDGNDAGDGPADDAAVAGDKAPLLPGDFASPANVTTYSRGLNGIMVDITGLRQGAAPTADDFSFRRGTGNNPSSWTAAAAPASITIRRGDGVNGSDRVTLVWPDYDPADPASAAANGWLEVTVKASERTGLSSAEVFAFGNLVGETGNDARVNAQDLGVVKGLLNTAAGVDSRVDFNRDGRVNALDLGIVKKYLNRTLASPALPPPQAPIPAPAPAAAPPATASILRDESASDQLA